MALVGLLRKNPMCKICISFEDDLLNEITLDLLFNRRTQEEICELYTPKLPEGVAPLGAGNLCTHRKHSDPALVAEDVLKKKGEAVTEGDMAAVKYAERFNDRLDRHSTLDMLYNKRLNSVQFLRSILEEKKEEYQRLSAEKTSSNLSATKAKLVEQDLRKVIDQIDAIESNIQQVMLKDIAVEKGPSHTFINQNFVSIFESGLKGFMEVMIPYILYQVFPQDIERGKEVVSKLTEMLEASISPTLNQVNKVKNQVPSTIEVLK